MGKKIISFLGSGNYSNVKYGFQDKKGNDNIIETRFVQEAVHKLVGEDAILYIGLTDISRRLNWQSGNKLIRNFKTSEEKEVYMVGLEEILDNKDIPYKEIELKNGQNESEIWDNFDSIFDVLEDGDELYIDITHSFRSIPIIMMSIASYAKFIKNISIKGIYYGAFDAQNGGIAPIIDLSIYNSITDWTIGAEKFISTGDTTSLNNRVSQTIREYKKKIRRSDEESAYLTDVNALLESFSKSLYTARGMNISKDGFGLKKALEDVREINIDELKPFREILDKIYQRVSMYSGDILKDIHYTVKLCSELNLVQQAYTLLRENIVSFVCIAANMDIDDAPNRLGIENVINCSRSDKDFKVREEYLDIKEKVDPYVDEKLAKLFNKIGEYRNDLNHGGYRTGPSSPDKFKKEINKSISEFEDIVDLDKLKLKDPCRKDCRKVLNTSFDSAKLKKSRSDQNKILDLIQSKDKDLMEYIKLFTEKPINKQIENNKYNIGIYTIGFSPYTTMLSLAVLRPDEEIVLIFTGGSLKYKGVFKEYLDMMDIRAKLICIETKGDSDTAEVFRIISEEIKNYPLKNIAVDITGGKKPTVASAYLAATFHSNIDIIYLDFEGYKDDIAEYGTEYLSILLNPNDIFNTVERRALEEMYLSNNFKGARRLSKEIENRLKRSQKILTEYKIDNQIDEIQKIYYFSKLYELRNDFNYRDIKIEEKYLSKDEIYGIQTIARFLAKIAEMQEEKKINNQRIYREFHTKDEIIYMVLERYNGALMMKDVDLQSYIIRLVSTIELAGIILTKGEEEKTIDKINKIDDRKLRNKLHELRIYRNSLNLNHGFNTIFSPDKGFEDAVLKYISLVFNKSEAELKGIIINKLRYRNYNEISN